MFRFDKTQAANRTLEFAQVLRDLIRRGDYEVGQMIPSERELSEQSGLSRTTVRRAVQLLVDEGLLYRMPGSGTYVGQSSPLAGPQNLLGLIAPTLTNPYYGELTDAIEQEASKRGYQLLVGQSAYNANDEANYLQRYADSPTVKGVLVVPNVTRLSVEAYRYITSSGTPFLFVSRSTTAIEADAVMPDRRRGAAEMINYLLGLGHRHIAYVRGIPPYSDSHLEGYQQALAEAGIAENPDLIVSVEADAEEAGRQGVYKLLERRVPITAIFARNDATASGVIQGLRAAGLRAPEDISVAGVDNTALSAHLQPPLTTLDNTLPEIGRLAVALLLDRVEGRYTGPPRQVTIRQRFVARASCTPPPAEPVCGVPTIASSQTMGIENGV